MTKNITKSINKNYLPTYINGMPVYGFGSWLKKNAGIIGTGLGAGLGSLVGMPTVGAQLGGTVGGAVQGNFEQNQGQQAQQVQQNQLNTNLRLNSLKDQQPYNQMACGGKMKADGGLLYSNVGNINMFASGGNLDDTTYYQSGGSIHETSPYNGIPIANNLVEGEETRFNSKKYGDYIFSNRLPFKIK